MGKLILNTQRGPHSTKKANVQIPFMPNSQPERNTRRKLGRNPALTSGVFRRGIYTSSVNARLPNLALGRWPRGWSAGGINRSRLRATSPPTAATSRLRLSSGRPGPLRKCFRLRLSVHAPADPGAGWRAVGSA